MILINVSFPSRGNIFSVHCRPCTKQLQPVIRAWRKSRIPWCSSPQVPWPLEAATPASPAGTVVQSQTLRIIFHGGNHSTRYTNLFGARC